MSDSDDGLYQYKYFTSYVRDTLLQDYSSGEVFKGGLTVITTLDVNTQNAAEQAADAKLSGLADNLELAMVAVDLPILALLKLWLVVATTTRTNIT